MSKRLLRSGSRRQRAAERLWLLMLPKQEPTTELSRGTRARPNQPSRYESAARGHEPVLLVSYGASCLCGAAFGCGSFQPLYISENTGRVHMYNATVGALVQNTTEIEHTPRKAAEPDDEEEYPTRAAVRRFLAADVVEQAGLVRQMRSDGESEAAIEREEILLRELRAKLKAAEQAIADAATR